MTTSASISRARHRACYNRRERSCKGPLPTGQRLQDIGGRNRRRQSRRCPSFSGSGMAGFSREAGQAMRGLRAAGVDLGHERRLRPLFLPTPVSPSTTVSAISVAPDAARDAIRIDCATKALHHVQAVWRRSSTRASHEAILRRNGVGRSALPEDVNDTPFLRHGFCDMASAGRSS